MIVLAALLVVAYVFSAIVSGAWWDIPAGELLELGASHAPAIADGELWRLISALFLHGGLLHLLFNGVALIEIGRPVERRLGSTVGLTIFLLAGAGGFFASLLWQPEAVSVGASGGIFGLLGSWAVLAAAPRIQSTQETPLTPRYRQAITVTVVVLIAFGAGFLIPGVDHAAHLGGLTVGVLLAAIGQWSKWRWPIFFASAAVVATSLVIASHQLPAEWKIEHQESRDFALRYRFFAEEDRAINQALQAIGTESRAGQLSDAAALERLDRQLIPRLQRSTAALSARDWHTPRLAQDAARWESYARFRADAVTALRNAIAASDPEHARDELKRFERLLAEAARLASNGADSKAKDAPVPAR